MLRPILNNSPAKPAASEGNNKKIDTPLKRGDLIKGTVIQKLKDGDFIISSAGRSFKAHSSLPLQDGKNYDFVVLSAKGRIELKSLEGEKKVTGNVIRLLSPANAIGRRITDAISVLANSGSMKNLPSQVTGLIGKLQELVNYPAQKKDMSEIIKWVNKNIQGNGIFWERKVLQFITGKRSELAKDMSESDLKGLLLKLIKCMDKNSGDHESMKSLSINIKEALNMIEQEQIMNLNTMRQDLGWFFHLPLISEEDFLSSEIFVKEKSEEGLHFSLFLDMSFTGKMNIDVSIVNNSLSLSIDVEKDETKNSILEGINELEEAFRRLGIDIANVRCEVREEILGPEDMEQSVQSSVDLVI